MDSDSFMGWLSCFLIVVLPGAFVPGCPVQPVVFHYRNKMVSFDAIGIKIHWLCDCMLWSVTRRTQQLGHGLDYPG